MSNEQQKAEEVIEHVRHHGEERVHGRPLTYTERDGVFTCSSCGSLDARVVINLLRTPGTSFSGTDKTTYKAYISPAGKHGKFYFDHLEALGPLELAEASALIRKCLGLEWFRTAEGTLRCRYPKTSGFYGWQTYGTIGEDGEPVFADDAPKPPDDAWWAALGAPK